MVVKIYINYTRDVVSLRSHKINHVNVGIVFTINGSFDIIFISVVMNFVV